MEYDIILFLEIIQDQGCLFLGEDSFEEERFHWYLSKNGRRRVLICISDETMTRPTASELLRELELPDLIDRLF